jgi:hypothetical protein
MIDININFRLSSNEEVKYLNLNEDILAEDVRHRQRLQTLTFQGFGNTI